MVPPQASPKLVYDQHGTLIEVILAARDFRAYLRTLAEHADWQALPPNLQDAIDHLMIDEVRDEKDEAIGLEAAFDGV